MTSQPTPPMVVRTAESNDVLRVNRSFTEETSLTAEDISGQPLTDWIHPDDAADFAAALETGAGRVWARHRTKSGGWLTLSWTVKSDGGRPVALGRIGAEAPAEPAPAEASTGAVETTQSATLDAMALIAEAKNPGMRCSILLVDEAGEHIIGGAGPSLPDEYNKAVEGLKIGPSVGSCGTAAYWKVPVIVEDIDNDPLWRELRDAAALAGVSACWSYPVIATDGTTLGAMALYADEPRAPTQGQLDGLEIAARMVALAVERDRLEDRLEQAARLEAIGRLAAGVAHDFNSVLTVILGQVAVMRDRKLPPDPEMLEAISKAAERASDITSQLLAFGRKQIRQPERVDVAEVALDVVRVLDPLLGDDISIALATDPAVEHVLLDRTQLRQVLLNLVLNARDAMPDGGRIEIATRLATSDDVAAAKPDHADRAFVAITVSDEGEGVDEEIRARVFEPFYSTKEEGSGLGLGLATVYGLVHQNHGHIALDSEVGRGTTFTILFPLTQAEEVEPIEPVVPDGEVRATVLVVEDDDGIRNLAVDVLQYGGYEVHQARDGAEALDMIEDGLVVDLLLTDVIMPVMRGGELVRRVRVDQPRLPVAYVSAYPFEELDIPALDAELEIYIAKPFSPVALIESVRQLVARAKQGTLAST